MERVGLTEREMVAIEAHGVMAVYEYWGDKWGAQLEGLSAAELSVVAAVALKKRFELGKGVRR